MILFPHTVPRMSKYNTEAKGHDVTTVNIIYIQRPVQSHLKTASRETNTRRLLDF